MTTNTTMKSATSMFWPLQTTNRAQLHDHVGINIRNIGHAFVKSETLDLFRTELVNNNVFIGYTKVPSQCKPDINILPFKINDKYIRNGCLDGIVEFDKNGDIVYDKYSKDSAEAGGNASYKKIVETYSDMNEIDLKNESFINKNAQLYKIYKNEMGLLGEESMLHKWRLDEINKKPSPQDTYITSVWNQEGGQMFENTLLKDTVENTVGCSKEIKTTTKIGSSMKLALVPVVLGGGYSSELSFASNKMISILRKETSEIDVQIALTLPNIIQHRSDATGASENKWDFEESTRNVFNKTTGEPIPKLGTVKQYRTTSFFRQPSDQNLSILNDVIDPIWMNENSSNVLSSAPVLKQALSKKRSSPWRMYHRVTYVERNLFPIVSNPPPPPEPRYLFLAIPMGFIEHAVNIPNSNNLSDSDIINQKELIFREQYPRKIGYDRIWMRANSSAKDTYFMSLNTDDRYTDVAENLAWALSFYDPNPNRYYANIFFLKVPITDSFDSTTYSETTHRANSFLNKKLLHRTIFPVYSDIENMLGMLDKVTFKNTPPGAIKRVIPTTNKLKQTEFDSDMKKEYINGLMTYLLNAQNELLLTNVAQIE
jgi:hypothetical protein